MKRFIFEERNGLYIIDLAKTLQQIRNAVEVVKEVVAKHKSILICRNKKTSKSCYPRTCGSNAANFMFANDGSAGC